MYTLPNLISELPFANDARTDALASMYTQTVTGVFRYWCSTSVDKVRQNQLYYALLHFVKIKCKLVQTRLLDEKGQF